MARFLCCRDLSLIFSVSYVKLTSISQASAASYLLRSLQVVCFITPTLGCIQCEFVCCDLCNLLNRYMRNVLQTSLLTAQTPKVYFPSDTSELINTCVVAINVTSLFLSLSNPFSL
jgi:hypothetical protein